MPGFYDVMVDVETTGLAPDHSAILQLTAVRFNFREQTVDHDWFHVNLEIPSNRFWDEGTRAWWVETNPELLGGILATGIPPEDAMHQFSQWAAIGPERAHFWAKPLSFDYPFVQSYCRQFGFKMPYPYYLARDVRSVIAGMTHDTPPFDDRTVAFEGVKHNSLFDCLHQIKILFAATAHARAYLSVHDLSGQPLFNVEKESGCSPLEMSGTESPSP